MKLPQNLIPSKVEVTRIPVNIIGILNPTLTLNIPTIELSKSKTRLVLELTYTNLPVDGLPSTCYQPELNGFSSAWDFYNNIKSSQAFNIEPIHNLFKIANIDLIKILLDNNINRLWNILEISEQQVNYKVSSFIVKIIESGLLYNTLNTLYNIPKGGYTSINQNIANISKLDYKQNNLNYQIALGTISLLKNNYDVVKIPGDVRAVYDRAAIRVTPIKEYDTPVLEGAIKVTYDTPVVIRETVSDNYQYSYNRAKIYRIMN